MSRDYLLHLFVVYELRKELFILIYAVNKYAGQSTVESLNPVSEVKFVEDLLRLLVVRVGLALEVLRDLVRVVTERVKRVLADVVHFLPEYAPQRRRDVLNALLLEHLVPP